LAIRKSREMKIFSQPAAALLAKRPALPPAIGF
jgi:hypothetical protein